MMLNRDCIKIVEELIESKRSSSDASSNSTLVIFHALPLELRERIYHYVLPPSLTSVCPLPPFLGLNLVADLTYNILHINRTTRIDAGIYNLRSRCFQLRCTNEVQNFERYLGRFPGSEGYGAVRRLSFPSFSQMVADEAGGTSYVDLIEKCADTLDLALTFRTENLQRGFHVQLWRMSEYPRRINPDDLSLVPTETVAQRYSLYSLLRLQRLKRVKIVVIHARVARRDSNRQVRDLSPDQLMGEVCTWLRNAFSRIGLAVEVVMRSTR